VGGVQTAWAGGVDLVGAWYGLKCSGGDEKIGKLMVGSLNRGRSMQRRVKSNQVARYLKPGLLHQVLEDIISEVVIQNTSQFYKVKLLQLKTTFTNLLSEKLLTKLHLLSYRILHIFKYC